MELNIAAGWIGLMLGVIAGAVIGLFFHREDWLGGYDAFPRRMVRLGHISFIGLGILNLLFGFTAALVEVAQPLVSWGSIALVSGAFAMPLCCFLAAWKKGFRHLFAIPVLLVSASIVLLLTSWQW